MHWRLPRAWQLALASHVLAALLLPAADTFAVLGWGLPTTQLAAVVSVTGLVFDDLDQDGELDPEEPGLPGVVVSNGIDVLTTAPDGTFSTTVIRDDSRFILLTVPRGYRATHGFFHRVGAEDADSAYFGLTVDPAADQSDFRFVHASDPHVFDATTAAEFGQSIAEAAALTPPIDFVVVTGDLVNNGSASSEQLAHAASALVAPPIPVHSAFGDHDADPDSLHVRNFEDLIGPSYYSFDRGPYHFVIHNDVRPVALDGSYKQFTWLANDIAAVPVDHRIFVFTHFQPNRAEIDLYKSLGVDAVFSGHWHSNRTQPMEGVMSFNSGTFRMGGIDRSSRGFRVIELVGGAVASRVRTGGISPRIAVVDPPAGIVPFGTVKIRAMGYGTSEGATESRYTITGPSGLVAEGNLTAQGGWCYGAEWLTTGMEPDTYEVTVELRNAGGVLASSSRSFTLEHVTNPISIPGAPWSSFRGDASGSGRFTTDLTPPLTLAWSRNVGGPTELSSPIVADERVYLAHGSDGALETAALVALDLLTGAEIWRHPTGAEVKGTPAIHDGRVVVVTSNGNVIAFDAATGARQWSTALGDSANRRDLTSPTIADDVVYAGGAMVTAALDLATGEVIWERSFGIDDWLSTIYSAPAVSGSRVVFGLYTGIYVLDRATGATIWARNANERECYRSPAIAGGVLYGAGDNFGSQLLRAFDLETGAELWAAPYPLGNSNSAPAVDDSLIIIGSGNGSLEAFARADGQSMWSLPIGPPIACGRPYARNVATVTSSPIVSGLHAFVGGDDGVLRAVRIADGSVEWSAELGAPIRSSPAASGNIMLIATTDGTLFAFVAGELPTAGTGEPTGTPALRNAIGAPWPNPFQPAGTIPFEVTRGNGAGPGGSASLVKTQLDLYDVTGRKVRTLTDATLPAGRHQVAWDGRDARGQQAASGVYFLRLTVDGRQAATGRLSLVR